MWKNATFATVATMTAVALAIFCNIDFLIPYKRILWRNHGEHMAIYAGLLAINLFAAYMLITRKLLLKDTGDKLGIIEQQIKDDDLLSEMDEHLPEDARR